jgi:hypothetical protein
MSTAEDNATIEAMQKQLNKDTSESNKRPVTYEDSKHMEAKMEASTPSVVTPADPENEPETATDKKTI